MSILTGFIFNTFMYPFEKLSLKDVRKNLISKASKDILEVGAGTGVNFNFYNLNNVSSLTVSDLEINPLLKKHKLNKLLDITYVNSNAKSLPFKDNSFDSIVSTLIFCAIDNPKEALLEMYRVLKPNGSLYFIEHIIPKENHYIKIANKCDFLWHSIGKCHINRETDRLFKESPFTISNLNYFGYECFYFISGILKK